jgi:hypothetical protein
VVKIMGADNFIKGDCGQIMWSNFNLIAKLDCCILTL